MRLDGAAPAVPLPVTILRPGDQQVWGVMHTKTLFPVMMCADHCLPLLLHA